VATWNKVKEYIKANYKVSKEDAGLLSMLFTFDDGRSQVVHVVHTQTVAGLEFATISSPFAKIGEVDLAEVLRYVDGQVVGGVVASGDYLLVRHAALLDSLDADDLDVPLRLVVAGAESLEEKFVGSDRF